MLLLIFLLFQRHLLFFWARIPSRVFCAPSSNFSFTLLSWDPFTTMPMIPPNTVISVSQSETEFSFLFIMLFLFFFSFIFISWRLITLQYCSGFCHTLTWISHGFTCIPHPNPPSHLPLYPIPLGLPSVPGPSTCLMHPTRAGDLFHYR